MKRIILSTIVCFIVTCPVFAQDEEVLLSIEETLWSGYNENLMGFYQGERGCKPPHCYQQSTP